MAVNAAEKASIIELAILMFDVAPGATYMPYLTGTYEQVGRSLSGLAGVLDDVGPFLEMHPANETVNAFADEFLGPLGLAGDTGARAFVIDALNSGMSKGQIAFVAWNFLHNLSPNAAQQYQDAKAIMENKAVVAAHYADVLLGAAPDFATLHSVIANVTADDASVAQAIDALDDVLAAGPVLTPGHDFVNPGGTAPINVTGVVDGDADGGTASGTYSAGDAIVGNGNTNVKLTVVETGDSPDVALTNIESLYLKSDVTSGEIAFDATGWTNVGMVRVEGGYDGLDLAIENLDAGTGVSINGVVGSAELEYLLGDGLAVTLDNTNTNATSSIVVETDGDVRVVVGEGGSFIAAGSNGLGDIDVSAVGELVDITLAGDVVEAGDIAIGSGDELVVNLEVANADEATVGAVFIEGGDELEADFSVQDIAGDAAFGAITLGGRDGSIVSMDVDSIDGRFTSGAIAVGVGMASSALVELTRVADGMTIGNLSVVGGLDSDVAAVLSGTDAATGALVAGTVTLNGPAAASLLVEDFSDATLGQITLATGADTQVDALFRDLSGDLTTGAISVTGGAEAVQGVVVSAVDGSVHTGNVTMTAGAESDQLVRMSGVDGDMTIGNVSVTAQAESIQRVVLTASGDVKTGSLVAHAGNDADIGIDVGADAGASLEVGVADVAAGESALIDVDVQLKGALADHALGAFTAGGVTLEAAQDADVTVRMGQSLVTTNAVDPASVGDLAIGDFDLVAGDNATVSVVVEQSAIVNAAASYADGDFLLGDISVSVSATTEDELSGGSNVSVNIDKSANPGEGAGGDFTVGNVSLAGGERASLDADITYAGSFAELGDVNIGLVSLHAGDDAMSVSARIAVSNLALNGDIGNVALSGADIAIGADSEATLDIELTRAGGTGSIGNVSIGTLTLDAGEDAEIGVDFDLFGVTPEAVMGNFAIGTVNVTAAEGARVDLGGLGIPAADLESIGTVGVGAVTAALGEDATLVFKAGIHVNEGMGAVTAGALNLTLGEGAKATHEVALSGATVGAVSSGGWTLVAGVDTDAALTLNVEGNLGAATMGAISLDLAQDAQVTANVSLGGAEDVAGATFGAVTVGVDDGAHAAVVLAVSAGDSAGDVTVGDVMLSVADLAVTTGGDAELDVGGLIDFSVLVAGDDADTLTVGAMKFDVDGTAAGDEIHAHIASQGDVVIGDIVVSGKGVFILDGQAHVDPTLDLNISYLSIATAGEITIGNVDFSGYENDVVLDLNWVDHGAANITAGKGDDTVFGTAGNNTLSGGDGVDTIDLSDGGIDTVHTASGDSGKTAATLDSIVSFAGGTNGAGDKLDFDLVAGSSGNYVEGTGAADFAAFITHANSALNTTVRYFAEVVGSDILVAVNYGSGEADMVVKLVGQTALANLSFQNFVA